MASWLVRSTLDCAVLHEFEPWQRVIVLCYSPRHFIVAVPLSTQEYKWVLYSINNALVCLLTVRTFSMMEIITDLVQTSTVFSLHFVLSVHFSPSL